MMADAAVVSSRDVGPRRGRVQAGTAVLAAILTVAAGLATAATASDLVVRGLAFAAMVAAVAAGLAAIFRGPAWAKAVGAIVAVIALMLGSTFFGLTYS